MNDFVLHKSQVHDVMAFHTIILTLTCAYAIPLQVVVRGEDNLPDNDDMPGELWDMRLSNKWIRK